MRYACDRVSSSAELVMPESGIDPHTLYRNVVHILEHGLRTATYKLATMTALIDFSVAHWPTFPANTLDVPIPDLARRVMDLYWRQSRPFDGAQLRQSTGSRSRILDSINVVRNAADPTDFDMTLDAAAKRAPEVFRRAIESVGMCLAQQPLPRLQRLPGAAKSVRLLYDDSFLHDNVSLSELRRHNNAIRLHAGIPQGLANLEVPLLRTLRAMWVDDVIRMNRISPDQRQRVEEHLFDRRLPNDSKPEPVPAPASSGVSATEHDQAKPHGGLAAATFAAKLNHLFDKVHSPDGQPYSSGEVAEKIRQSGFPLYVGTVTQLRAGVGPAPNKHTIKALAMFFDVRPTYFSGDGDFGDVSTPWSTLQSDQLSKSDVPSSSDSVEGNQPPHGSPDDRSDSTDRRDDEKVSASSEN